ncbi:MAG: hypothetical protein ABI560_15380 [Myxococcales bacterium]
MKNSPERDPRRWKDTPKDTLVTASGTEAEIASAARLLCELAPPDELRLAQLARRAAQETVMSGEGAGRTRSFGPRGLLGFPAWGRTAVVVVVSLLVGGVAAAVSGNFIRYLKKQTSGPSVASTPAAAPLRSHGRKRRWRLDVSGPAQLDLSVGPDSTEVAVVSGEAAVSGADLPGRVALDRGTSWRASTVPGDAASVVTPPPPSPALPAAMGPHNPFAAPAPGVVPGTAKTRRRLAFTEPTRRPAARPLTGRLEEGSVARGVGAAAPAAATLHPAPTAPAATEPSPLIVLLPLRQGAGVAPAVRLQPAAAAPPVESEATMVARALTRLRRDHDPAGALAALDQRDRSYSGGNLRREAALARAEALLGLNRHSEALKVLDGVTLQPSAADRRARLARAELRAEEGQRAEAIADFDRVLGNGGDDTLAERALYGRAVCRLRGGDLGAARTDLRAYVLRFPAGQHRAEVQQSLARLGG